MPAILVRLRRVLLAALALSAATGTAFADGPLAPAQAAAHPDYLNEPDMGLLYEASRAAKAIDLLPGASYRLIELPAYGVKVHAWTFDARRFRLRIVDEKDAHGTRIGDQLAPADVFAINGGFFERDKQKVLAASGLLIVDGKEVAPEHPRAGSGIVYSDGRSVFIGYRKDLADHHAMRSAVQVGPILVDPGGKVGVADKQHDRQNRSAICVRDGAFLAVAVQGGLSLFQLASLLAMAPPDGLGCDTALNLDGGPSTQALFRSGSRRIAVLGGWPVANALLVSPAAGTP